MKPLSFMLLAGEPSGDGLAAELVQALRQEARGRNATAAPDLQPLIGPFEPQFFGAGGPQMADVGMDLALDLTAHAVIGLADALKGLLKWRRIMHQLLDLACLRQPDVVVCVDFSGFNRRFVQALRQRLRAQRGTFNNWRPKLVQYVSPQVWASRPGRAKTLERDLDLLLSIFPFEKDWYALRFPRLKVEFVGHPMIDRYALAEGGNQASQLAEDRPAETKTSSGAPSASALSRILLLPGSRPAELSRHLPVMVDAMQQLKAWRDVRLTLVLPNETLVEQARASASALPELRIQAGGLGAALAAADIAIASTGTVTMECAYFGVPTVALYKTSWSNYQIGRRIVQLGFIAMPNVLTGEPIFPEFVQYAATPENIARAARELLEDESRRAAIRTRLAKLVATLGGPGANQRAAAVILDLLS